MLRASVSPRCPGHVPEKLPMSCCHRDCPDSAWRPSVFWGSSLRVFWGGCEVQAGGIYPSLGPRAALGGHSVPQGRAGGARSSSSGARRRFGGAFEQEVGHLPPPRNFSHFNWDQSGSLSLPGRCSPLRGGMQGCKDAGMRGAGNAEEGGRQGGKEGGPGVEEAGPAPTAAAPAPARAAMPERFGLGDRKSVV